METQKLSGYQRVDNDEVRKSLEKVHEALKDKGYNPITQIVGYILSGDPTYITSHMNARALIGRIERDELLEEMVREYLRDVL
jgi:uncharacterized protein (UPF0297 family)